MKQIPAFTLLELFLYLFFMILIVHGICLFFMTSQKNLVRQAHFCERSIRDLVVLDLFKRDVMKGCMQRVEWDEKNIIWMQEMIDKRGAPFSSWVGWSIVDGGLSRAEGIYDPARHVWLKKQASFFGCTLTSLTLLLKPEKSAMVEGVLLSYTQAGKSKACHDYICLRNKVLG